VPKAALVAVVLSALFSIQSPIPFNAPMPDGTPPIGSWEKVAGDTVVGKPELRVQYEFYVNPRRPGLYELIRYRVSRADGSATATHPGLEKVQWHAGTNDFQRFECGPGKDGPAPCRWRWMRPGSDEHQREVPTILWVYGVHSRLVARGETR
jgi:hypothetical protein